jgi:hypothetical protein
VTDRAAQGFTADELRTFLRALDGELASAASLVVIGGGALALAYVESAATHDIDTFDSSGQEIKEAAKRARRITGLFVPIGDSSIAQLPEGSESRLRHILPELKKLVVHVLEQHDLAVSKLLRGNIHDRQQLNELHKVKALDLGTLNARFDDLIGAVIGENAQIEARWARYHFVYEVWGELAAEDVKPAD